MSDRIAVSLGWRDMNERVHDDRQGRPPTGSTAIPGGANFIYDGVGRLTDAWVPGHHLAYGFADATCGALLPAGKDTNRTSVTDNGGAATTS